MKLQHLRNGNLERKKKQNKTVCYGGDKKKPTMTFGKCVRRVCYCIDGIEIPEKHMRKRVGIWEIHGVLKKNRIKKNPMFVCF